MENGVLVFQFEAISGSVGFYVLGVFSGFLFILLPSGAKLASWVNRKCQSCGAPSL